MTIKTLLIAFLLGANSVQAAELEITWKEPKKYTDVRAGGADQARYRADVFYALERSLKRTIKHLPEGNTLKIEVTDLDLAGDIRFSHGYYARVISHPFSPRIKFSYQLLDANDVIIQEGEENIRDTSFLTNQSLRFKREPLGAEMKIFDDWFKDNFSPIVAKN